MPNLVNEKGRYRIVPWHTRDENQLMFTLVYELVQPSGTVIYDVRQQMDRETYNTLKQAVLDTEQQLRDGQPPLL